MTVQLENGFWGVVGSECDEDSEWGTYPTQEAAQKARENLEECNWDASRAGINSLQVPLADR